MKLLYTLLLMRYFFRNTGPAHERRKCMELWVYVNRISYHCL